MSPTSAMPGQVAMTEMGAANPAAGDSFKIEEILRRAYQIHREHGGMFGYDFEDWAQAWSELPQSGSPGLELASENGAVPQIRASESVARAAS